MNKRSRTNIQVFENRSHKRIRQYGGAANPVIEKKETTKQIFKGDAMKKLNDYLDLDSFNIDNQNGEYKFKFRQTTIPEIQKKLEPSIQKLQYAIVELGTLLSSEEIDRILTFNLDDNQSLLDEHLQKRVLQLKYLDTKKIIEKIAKEVLNQQTPNHLTKNLEVSFQQSNEFREQVKALFGSSVDYIPITLIGLTSDAINTGWQKITNRQPNTQSHISSNQNILSSAENIDILENGNIEQINGYFEECEKLQVYYNQKHNEIIELYNILRGIITIKLTLVNILLGILPILQINITRRGTETKKTTIYEPDYEESDYNSNNNNYEPEGKPSIMIRKPKLNLEDILEKLKQQKTLLEAARGLIPPQPNADSQADRQAGSQVGGAAAAAVPAGVENKMEISGLSGGENNEFTITNLDPDKIKPGQNIMIIVPGANHQALLARFIGSDTANVKVFKFKLLQGAEVFNSIIQQFNNAELEYQKIYIDFIDYVIPNVETMQVITALKQIAIVEKTLLRRQESRMIPEANLPKIARYANINSYPANTADLHTNSVDFSSENNEEQTLAKQQEIQRVILNCYDLQNLYLIKHFEFINLFKMILYFSDMYMVNISIFNYIILLFQTDKLSYKYIDKEETIPGRGIRRQLPPRQPAGEPYQTTVNLPKDLIDNLPELLNQQAKAITSMIPTQSPPTNTQTGGAAAAATAEPVQSPESIFQGKMTPLIGDIIPYKYANLHELENKISGELLKGYNAELFKAWLLVRIERLNRLLIKPETKHELKPKIKEMITEYYRIFENHDSLDISDYINKYSELISSDYILGKIKEEIQLLPETVDTHSQDVVSSAENQNRDVIEAKKVLLEKLKEQGVCTLGNKAACENYYDESYKLLKTTLINMGFRDEDIQHIITLDGTINDNFAVNQIALYLLKKKNVSFEGMLVKVNDEITESQSKINIIKIIRRILKKKQEIEKQRVEEEQHRREAEEEARTNPTYGKLKKKSEYFKLNPVIQIMSVFEHKNEEQKQRILTDINLNTGIAEIFTKFQGIYRQLDEKKYTDDDENTKFLDDMKKQDSEELSDKKFQDYLKFIKGLVSQLSDDNITVILANLLEIINGAARAIIRIKPIEQRNDNLVPEVQEDNIDNYKVKDYLGLQQPQSGGYNYTDIISIDPNNNLKLRIGAYCSGEILPNKRADDYLYGPFSAVYPPQYNNFDIYANLFGVQTIQEIREQQKLDTSIQSKINGKLNRGLNSQNQGETRGFNAVNNSPQGLMEKLANGGSIVIFGYGFSGSGKTYALIEGSKELTDGNYKYDPSMLEQFIKSNSDVIDSVEFMELYPLGIGENGDEKIITQGKEIIQSINDKTKPLGYNEFVMYAEEIGESNVDPTQITDLYAPIQKGEINYQAISRRIKLLERHRIHKLRILATPNNDNSSRSFLQITLNINNPSNPGKMGKLVFFDMPGTENTVRIKAEFMGSDIFASIIGKYKLGEQYSIDKNGNAIAITQKTKQTISSRIIINKEGTVDNKEEDKSQLHNIHSAGNLNINYYQSLKSKILKIFAIQAKKTIDKPSKDDKKNENLAFKYNLMGFTLFNSFGIIIKDNLLGQVGREMALFFNGIDSNSIYETTKPIIFFSNEDHKNIFTTFMKFFNKKDKGLPIFYSTDNTGKCKIKQQIDANDILNLDKIFSLKNDTTISIEHEFFFVINGGLANLNKNVYYSLDDIINFNTNKPPQKAQALKNIYFYNPLIKYLYLLINFAYKFKFEDKAKIIDSEKTEFYIVCNFLIYKFIKFIVEQGRTIITTLEHIKFFFLSRTDDGITNYNKEALSKAKGDTNGNKAFLFTSIDAALKQDKTYIIPMKYGTRDKSITIEEKVNQGQFKKFQLLSMLQDLSGNQPNLSLLKEVKTEKDIYPDLMTPLESGAGASATSNKYGAIFVMFANIKAYIKDPTTYKLTNTDDVLEKELPKLCTAEFDTLEFAESISSTTYNKNLQMTGVGAAAAYPGQGGAMKYSRAKKYLPSRYRKHTLKRLGNSQPKSIYSRRSKKYQSS